METKALATYSPALLDELTSINLDDLFDAAGLTGWRHTPLQRLFQPSARRFALVAQEFDRRVGEQGLAQGSAWVARRMSGGVNVSGAEHVPPAGPVVVLANHPGMTDTVSLFASLASRPDLRVIALERPFLRALPHLARHLIPVPDHEVGRMGVVRAGVAHLKQGGALLTFPSGAIEPDPAVFGRRKAVESLLRWSDSFTLFARRVPQTRFVPALVSQVISPQAQRHVLTALRRTAQDKQRLAAALQVALPRYQKGVASVAFGRAQAAGTGAGESLRAAIAGELHRLIEASAGPDRTDPHDDASGRGAALQHDGRALMPRPVSP